MSAVAERSRKSAGSKQAPPALPQVNLLPPEVTAARGLHKTKRWLLVGIGATAVACIVAFVLSLASVGLAQGDLDEAQAETLRLQSEKAKYAEVPLVLASIDRSESALLVGFAAEVDWRSYLDAFTAVLPEGVSVDTLKVDQSDEVVAQADFLQPLGIGQVQMTGRSLTVPDVASWIDVMDSIPGFDDARVATVVVHADEAGTTYYSIEATVQVSTDAILGRFLPTDQGK